MRDVIVSFAVEFDDESAMRKAVKKLWDDLGVTGEMEIRPMDEGRWRVEVHSEKPVRDTTIEALGGKQVKAGSAVAKI